MAQPKVYIEPKNIIKPKHNSNDDHELLCAQIIEEIQSLKKNSRRLKDSMKNHEHLIVFVHGFNNNELEMHERSAYLDQQFGTDQVITTAFNWGSYCSMTQYWKDQKSATKCAKYFALYLEEIRKNDIHVFKQVDIVCHSMGNHILVQSIMHCYQNEKLHVFKESNIIAVAPDAEKQEYRAACKCLADEQAPIVSNWVHYWNSSDAALFLSKFANAKLNNSGITISVRAGSGHINFPSKHFQSIEWDRENFLQHGYVGNILDKDHEFKRDLFRWLKLPLADDNNDNNKDDDKKMNDAQQLNAQQEMVKYSKIWNSMYSQSDYINKGGINTDNWWKDLSICKKYDSKCGTIRLQEHTGGTKGVVGFARSVGWWSNHNDKFRIIWRHKQNSKWKELYHSNDLGSATEKYSEYLETIKWKKRTFN